MLPRLQILLLYMACCSYSSTLPTHLRWLILEKILGTLFMKAKKNCQKIIVFLSVNANSVKPNFFS